MNCCSNFHCHSFTCHILGTLNVNSSFGSIFSLSRFSKVVFINLSILQQKSVTDWLFSDLVPNLTYFLLNALSYIDLYSSNNFCFSVCFRFTKSVPVTA